MKNIPVLVVILMLAACNQHNNTSSKNSIKAEPDNGTEYSISWLNAKTGLEEEVTGDFFSKLVSEHRRKVIYIDVWATWCGPCRDEFEYSHRLHEYFRNKPVVFVNLCLLSDRNEWKFAMKDLNIEGENYYFDPEQSDILMKKLKIWGFPTFMIIDRKGKIINDSAPGPSSGKTIAEMLQKAI